MKGIMSRNTDCYYFYFCYNERLLNTQNDVCPMPSAAAK